MSTRSTIWVRNGKEFEGVYCHFDGYPSHTGVILAKHYDNEDKVKELIKGGAMRGVTEDINDVEYYNDTPNFKVNFLKDMKDYTQDYNYVFDEKWYIFEDDNVNSMRPMEIV